MVGAKGPIIVRDDLGDELVFSELPRRIVSLVPSMTETVIELGAVERLVGVTNYCVHPADVVAGIRKIGGTKGFSFEKIAALQPDLILANKEENREHHVVRLRKTCPVFVSYPRAVPAAIQMVRDLGTLTGTSAVASEFATACDRLLQSLEPSIIERSLRTACMIWRDPWMVAGVDTYMSALLEAVGFINVFSLADERYPETTLAEVMDRKPDVIILPDEPYVFAAADQEFIEGVLKERGSAARTLLFDGSFLTWFGTRTLKGLQAVYDAKRKLLFAS